jgi:hypothetical protein
MILFQAESGSLISVSFQFILSKLYVNSLLATLNTRKHLRALTDETIEFALPTITAATCVSLDSDALSANRTSTHIQPSV